MKPRNSIFEILGWVGAVGVLTAYGLLSLDIIKGNSITYHGLFLIGSVGLAIITYERRTFQPFIVNILFVFFALIALIRILFF